MPYRTSCRASLDALHPAHRTLLGQVEQALKDSPLRAENTQRVFGATYVAFLLGWRSGPYQTTLKRSNPIFIS